jgi:hypothetical protein
MLASTVQFSRYGKSLHIPHRQPRTPGRYDEHEALHKANDPTRSPEPARSLRTQQRAYRQLPTTTTFQTPRREPY